MSSVLLSDHPICQLMADKAMHDPKYKVQLQNSVSGRCSWKDKAIEWEMTEFRHKLLMLSQIEDDTCHRHSRRVPKVYRNSITKLSARRAPANSRRALMILASDQRLQRDSRPFPLLRLPREIRQQIYIEALIGTSHKIVVKSFDNQAYIDDFGNNGLETFYGNRASPHWETPVSTFETATSSIYGKDITTGLLRVSKSIYSEAVPILYQSHTFDFGVDVFGIVPFLRKMTPLAQANVSSIHMEYCTSGTYQPSTFVLEETWHVRENTWDWPGVCGYIADNLQLKELSINANTEGLKSITSPCDPPFNPSNLDWVRDLVQIRGLHKMSYHVSRHGHGLQSLQYMRSVDDPPADFKPSQDDIVDGDVKGAKPGLGEVFKYLRAEMLRASPQD